MFSKLGVKIPTRREIAQLKGIQKLMATPHHRLNMIRSAIDCACGWSCTIKEAFEKGDTTGGLKLWKKHLKAVKYNERMRQRALK